MGPELSDGYVPAGRGARPRERIRDVSARSQGTALTVSGEESGAERTFPMELIPRIVPGDEWAMAEAAQQ